MDLKDHLVRVLREEHRSVHPDIFNLALKAGEAIAAGVPRTSNLQLGFYNPYDPMGTVAKYSKWDIYRAVAEAMRAYFAWLPASSDGPFTTTLGALPGVDRLIYHMTNKTFGQFDQLAFMTNFNENVRRETAKHGRSGSPVYPQDHPEPHNIAELYLKNTPLLPLFALPHRFNPFTELNRCAHHWCLGKTRRGKTTFLRHLISADLVAVAREECSLVVVDSKTLVSEMRTLKQFGIGEPLDGRLILIDSDQTFPLNPFHMPDKNHARAVLLYMLGSLQEASDLQSGALGYYIDAALQSDEPSLQTILDYMRLPKGKVPPRLDKPTTDWFLHTRPTLHASTSSSIQQRLANFLRDHRGSPLMKMLTAERWGLDLWELHQGGKVLLVDTDWLKNGPEGANLLGRLIIALVENLAMRRMKKPAVPVWVYVDEASDYLANDTHFVQILTKAAAAKVGMTVAYQYKGMQGIGSDIEAALENAEIHSVCEQRGRVELTIEERPLSLPVSKLEFNEQPQMDRDAYKKLRELLAFTYPHKVTVKPAEEAKPEAVQVEEEAKPKARPSLTQKF